MSDGPTQMARDRQRKLMDAWHLATPRAREIALAVLKGEYNCGHCSHREDCVGGEKDENVCQEWTPRDTEGSE